MDPSVWKSSGLANSGRSGPRAGRVFSARVNVSPTGDIELVAEDQLVAPRATPNASVKTGTHTYWDMATFVFKAG